MINTTAITTAAMTQVGTALSAGFFVVLVVVVVLVVFVVLVVLGTIVIIGCGSG
jgi:hypothetical protein